MSVALIQQEKPCLYNLAKCLPLEQSKKAPLGSTSFGTIVKPFQYVISSTRIIYSFEQMINAFEQHDAKKMVISILKITLAIAGLIGTCILNVYAMIGIACYDVFMSFYEVVVHLYNKEYQEAFESFLQALNVMISFCELIVHIEKKEYEKAFESFLGIVDTEE